MPVALRYLILVLTAWTVLASRSLATEGGADASLERNMRKEMTQAVDMLGVGEQIEQLHLYEKDGRAHSEDALLVKGFLLKKILRAVLEVRQACNKVDLELAYTYDIMQKEERRNRLVLELFNLANFAQLSTFYTMEPFVRIHQQFVTSAIFTTTSGSLNTAISTGSRVYNSMAKASHVSPSSVLAGIVDGKPVDATGLPPLVLKFLDSRSPISGKSRRQELFDMWLSRWNIDASKEENLCGIADKEKASVALLRSRILLLWSLHTVLQDFDHYLLSLLKSLDAPSVEQPAASKQLMYFQKGNSGTLEAARLLKIEPQLAQLIALERAKDGTKEGDELELFILQHTLEGALEAQVASDKVDEELNYNYHVILADLLRDRAKWLQYNYNLNFLQSGVLGIVAGRLYLSRLSFAGDQQFVVSGSNGTALTLLAMLQMRGFWRKVDREPNSLAEVLNLHPSSQYCFSPLVSAFLNSVPPGSTDGKTRSEELNETWRKYGVTTVDLNRPKNLQALSAMPPLKYDTIKIVSGRIVLLHSLKKELESFQSGMLGILQASDL
jgi:hypothetical protein